ncbi:ABC transporter permease, partial [candidate division KSB3 bacterium]
MLVRIISDSLKRGMRAKLLLTLIIALGSAVLTAMVMLSVDIGDQLNRQLKS